MASDLNQVMSEFAANGNGDVDDDELMAELEAMGAGRLPPHPIHRARAVRARAPSTQPIVEKTTVRAPARPLDASVRLEHD